MSFDVLGLAEPILRAVSQVGHTTPTPIQAAAIPVITAGRDVIAIAQTGTGKTAAFALPILSKLAADRKAPVRKRCRVLVLSPTRELASQIVESFRTYGRQIGTSVALVIGGVPMGKQIRSMNGGVDVLVATPGRLLDHTGSRSVDLSGVEIVVIDEADRMLDMGFVREVRKIAALVPRQRQTLMFSATMPKEIAQLASEMLTNPTTVSVAPPAATVTLVEQRAVHVSRAGKQKLLAQLLSDTSIERAIVFSRTKHGADRVVRALEQDGIPAQALHGNKSQGQRERTLAAFRSGKVRTLVATDIAARGIHVDGVSHVVNFDLPEVAESYVHRIGRTARAGNSGIAISFCSPDEAPLLRAIEKLIRQTIPSERAAGTPERASAPLAAADPDRPERAHRRPQRNQRNHQQQRPQQQRPQQQRSQRGARPQRQQREVASPHSGNDIGAVGFMRPSRRQETRPAQ